MSGFGDNFEQNDVDPAAEFLAREQDELAGLEDEVKPAAITVPPPIANGDDPSNAVSSFEMVEANDEDVIEFKVKKELQNDDVDDILFGAADNNDTALVNASYENRQASPSPPTSLKQEAREEPEKIRKWREEQITRLEEKDKEEEKKKEELRGIAKKELEDWYKSHEETIAKTKAANRNAEKQFVAEDDDIVPGTEWERIAKLCDFNPKAKPGSKDVSRLRSIILQMKQNPIPIKNKS